MTACERWWSTDQPTSQPAAHLRSRARASAGCDGAAQTVEGAFPLSACYQLVRGIPVAARSHPIARSAPIINGPSVRARPSTLCTLARPRGATVEGLWVRRCFWQSPRRRARLSAPTPLLSVFRDPRRSPGSPARSPLSLFHRESREDEAEDALTL